MNVSVEKQENNMALLTIEVDAEEFDKAVESAYQRQKNRFSIPGFRKGRATRAMIEKMYGKGVFYEDAANTVINRTYADAADESGEDIVSNPVIDIISMNEGETFIYTAQVALKPPVSLGKYKGVEVEKFDAPAVGAEEIDAEIDRERERNATFDTITDRAVQSGDMIALDFEGFVDGVPFEGGKGDNYALTIGSNSFIPGFEDQLIGMQIGEEKDVEVTFPEDYHAEDLKGKPAVFHCKVNSIREKKLPEADDAFADEVSEFSTMKEYREDIEKRLLKGKEDRQKQLKEDLVMEAIVADAAIDIPPAMLETQQRQLFEEFSQRMQMQGLSIDQYMQYTGQNADQMIASMKPDAERRIRTRLVLEEIAKQENITATEEEFEEEIKKMAEGYRANVETVKKIFENDKEKARLMQDIAVQKAITFVTDAAKEKKQKKEDKKDENKAEL